MRDLRRTVSREESQNNENEDMELGNKHTDSGDTNAELLDSRNCTEETKVDMDLLNAKQGERKKSWCYYLNCTFMTVLTLLVAFLLYKELIRETPDSPIRADNQQHTDPPPKVSAFQQSESNDYKFQTLAEEYTIDMQRLHATKVLRWIPAAGNKQILTMPSTKNGCIKFKTDGKFKVLNTITITYKNEKSIYHAVARKSVRKEGMRVLQKRNYQWQAPQSGRRPSTVQFLVDVQTGDELCVQKNSHSKIYAGSTDNIFLIEKLN